MKCKACGREVLRVGDRVEAVGSVDGLDLTGKRGVVIHIHLGKLPVLVEFEGFGRYGRHEDFRVIKAKKKGVRK